MHVRSIRLPAPIVIAGLCLVAVMSTLACAGDETAAGQGRIYKIGVEGMMCPTGCAPRVQAALESIEGVSTVSVSFDDKTAWVTVAPGKELTSAECDSAFANQGYFVSSLEEQRSMPAED